MESGAEVPVEEVLLVMVLRMVWVVLPEVRVVTGT